MLECKKSSRKIKFNHWNCIGITEKTDATAIVISEQTGKMTYFKNGDFIKFDSHGELNKLIIEDLTF